LYFMLGLTGSISVTGTSSTPSNISSRKDI
jgi:hypothetical protein